MEEEEIVSEIQLRGGLEKSGISTFAIISTPCQIVFKFVSTETHNTQLPRYQTNTRGLHSEVHSTRRITSGDRRDESEWVSRGRWRRGARLLQEGRSTEDEGPIKRRLREEQEGEMKGEGSEGNESRSKRKREVEIRRRLKHRTTHTRSRVSREQRTQNQEIMHRCNERARLLLPESFLHTSEIIYGDGGRDEITVIRESELLKVPLLEVGVRRPSC